MVNADKHRTNETKGNTEKRCDDSRPPQPGIGPKARHHMGCICKRNKRSRGCETHRQTAEPSRYSANYGPDNKANPRTNGRKMASDSYPASGIQDAPHQVQEIGFEKGADPAANRAADSARQHAGYRLITICVQQTASYGVDGDKYHDVGSYPIGHRFLCGVTDA